MRTNKPEQVEKSAVISTERILEKVWAWKKQPESGNSQQESSRNQENHSKQCKTEVQNSSVCITGSKQQEPGSQVVGTLKEQDKKHRNFHQKETQNF